MKPLVLVALGLGLGSFAFPRFSFAGGCLADKCCVTKPDGTDHCGCCAFDRDSKSFRMEAEQDLSQDNRSSELGDENDSIEK